MSVDSSNAVKQEISDMMTIAKIGSQAPKMVKDENFNKYCDDQRAVIWEIIQRNLPTLNSSSSYPIILKAAHSTIDQLNLLSRIGVIR